MADANVDSVQQSQDAQNLDNLTSLQQADSTTAPQPTGGTADATITTTNPPAPDTPSLYNEVTGTQNNQPNLEAAGTNSLLDTATFTNDGRDGAANESPTVGTGGAFGTEVNTGDSQVQYTVTNENPTIQGSGTNGAQNTVGGTQGGVAADGTATTEPTTTTETTTAPTDAPITNTTPEPTLNPDGTSPVDPTVDPLVTDPTPQEPAVAGGNVTVSKEIVAGSSFDEAGDTIGYVLTVTNAGQSDLTTVVVTDAKLETVTSVVVKDSAGTVIDTGYDFDPATGTVTFADMPEGDVYTIAYTYEVTPADITAGSIDNTVTVDSDQDTFTNSDNNETGTTNIGISNVTVSKEIVAGSSFDEAGDTIGYVLTVTNAGQSDLTTVVVTDAKLETVTSVVVKDSAGTVIDTGYDFDPATGTVTFADMPEGDVYTIAYTYEVTPADITAGSIDNTVTVDSDQDTFTNSDNNETGTTNIGISNVTVSKEIVAGSSFDEAGDTIGYVLTVTNAGQSDLTTVVVTDAKLETVTSVVVKDSAGTVIDTGYDFDPATGTVTFADMPEGDVYTIAYTYEVTPADITAGSIDNTVTVDSDQDTFTNSDNNETGTTNIGISNVTVSKEIVAGSSFDEAGDTIGYVLTVTNAGQSDLTTVVVTDAKLETVTSVVVKDSAGTVIDTGYDFDPATGTVTFADMPEGDVYTIAYTYEVTPADITAGSIDNTVTVDSDQDTFTNSDNNETGTTNIGISNVTVSKEIVAGSSFDEAGDTIGYVLTVTNAGQSDLTTVVVTDAKLETVTSVVVKDSAGTVIDTGYDFDPATGTVTFADMPEGDVYTIAYTYEVTPADITAGSIDNTVTVDSDQDTFTNSDNNETGTTNIGISNVTVSKEIVAGSSFDEAGDTIGYVLTVTNAGQSDLTTVVVTDAKLETVTSVVVKDSAGTVIDTGYDFDPATGTVTFADMPEGDVYTIAYTYEVTPADITAGSIDNTVTVDSDQDTFTNSDNNETGTTNIGISNVTVSKEIVAGSSFDEAGDTIGYVLTVTNAGQSDLTTVVVTDAKLETVTSVVVKDSAGTVIDTGYDFDPATGTVTFADMPEGDVYTIAYTYEVTPADITAGSIDNTVTVDSDQDTFTNSDNNETGTTNIGISNVTVSKEIVAGSSFDEAGDTIGYVLTVTNAGQSDLTTVVVTDAKLETVTSVVVKDSAGTVIDTGYDFDPATGTVTFADMPEGDVYTIAYTYEVTPADITAGSIDNTVTVDSDQDTFTNSDNNETGTTNIGISNVTVSKEIVAGSSFDEAGDTIGYVLTVTNAGQSDLTTVVVTDAKLETVTSVVVKDSAGTVIDTGYDFDPATGTVTFADMPEGDVYTIAYTYEVTPADITAGSIDNTVTVDSDQDTFTNSDNNETGTTNIGISNVTVSKEIVAGSSFDEAGDTIGYVLTVTNAGQSDLTTVVVTDAKLETVTSVVVKDSAGTVIDTGYDFDPATGTVTFADMPEGDVYTIAYTYEVTPADITAGSIDNTVTVDSDQDTFTNSDNNETGTTNIGISNVTVSKEIVAGSSFDEAGDTIGYVLTVTNAGQSDLTTVVVTDAKLETVTSVVVKDSAGTVIDTGYDFDPATGTVTFADMPEGDVYTIAYTYEVTPADITAGSIDNTVTVDSDQDTFTNSDNNETGTTNIGISNVTVSKEIVAGSSFDEAGDTIGYVLTVTNAGQSDLTTVVVTDAKLETVTSVVVKDSAGTVIDTGYDFDPATGTVTFADMPEGDVYTIAYTYEVTPADITAGSIDNTVTVDSDQDTFTNSDNNETGTTNIGISNVTVSKEIVAGSSFDEAGDTIGYVLTVTNAGQSDLTTVVVTDAKLETVTSVVVKDSAGTVIDTGYDFDPATGTVTFADMPEGDVYTIAYTYEVTPADITAGSIDNTVTVDSDQDEFDNTDINEKDSVVARVTTPELSITKVAAVVDIGNDGSDGTTTQNSTGFVDSVNDLINYVITVENIGSTTVTGVKVFDAMFANALDGDVYVDLNKVDVLHDESGKSYILYNQLSKSDDIVITFTYKVTQDDIDSLGLQPGENQADFEVDNVASVESAQTSSISADYSVELKSYSDIAIYKDATVNGINNDAATVGSLVEYTLKIANEGAVEQTNIVVNDSMFAKTLTDSSLDSGQQLHVIVYDADGSINHEFDALLDPVTHALSFGAETLTSGQFATITYSYLVNENDFNAPVNVVQSIFDYTNGNGPQGDPGDPVEFSYGSFSAYVNTNGNATYDVGGEPAIIFVNNDNTGYAVGVNSGVMHGDKNAGQEHLKMEFTPSPINDDQSLVEGVSIVFTNATTVELGFKAGYGIDSEFTGSLIIGSSGNNLTYSLREVVGQGAQFIKGQNVAVYDFLDGTNTTNASSGIYSFANNLGQMYTLSVANGPGGAQNLLYTLTFNPASSGLGNINSFDFWVVGDLTTNSEEQIKVVDVKFDVLDYGDSQLENIATVSSAEDNATSLDGVSDEVSAVSISLLTDLSVADALIAQALGEKNIIIKDTAENIINNSSKIEKNSLSTIKVIKDDGQPDVDGIGLVKSLAPKLDDPDLYAVKLTIADDVIGTAKGDVKYSFAFSEAVTGFDVADISVTGGTIKAGSFTADVGGSVYTVIITPTANSTTPIMVGVSAGVAFNSAGSSNIAAIPNVQQIDNIAPTITITDNQPNAVAPNSVVTYTLNFSEAVTGFDATDITVTGGTKGTLNKVSDTQYTMDVTAGSSGTIEVSVASNKFVDAVGNPNASSVSAVSQVIDSTAPTITITDNQPNAVAPNSVVTYTLNFSEAVTGFDATDITVTGGTKGTLNKVSDTQYTMDVTAGSSGTIEVSVASNKFVDAVGNPNASSVSAVSQVIDSTAPTITITDNQPNAVAPNSVVTYTLNFSEAVTGFDATDITVTGGTKGTLNKVSDTQYTMDVTAGSSGTIEVSVASNKFVDAVGNPNASSVSAVSQVIDSTAPTITITDNQPNAVAPNSVVTYTLNFSEAVTGFDATDITVTGGTKGTLNKVSDTQYTMDVTAGSSGTIEVSVASNKFVDAVGNPNASSVSAVSQVIDSTAPTITITDNQPNAVAPNSVVTYTLNFSEAVTGFDATDITVTGGTKGTLNKVSDTQYTMDVTAGSSGTIEVSVASNKFVDAVGNPNASSVSAVSQVIDSTAPTITITDNQPNAVAPNSVVTYTLNFSEAVTGFDATDITVTGGTKGTLNKVSDTQYTMDVTAGSSGTIEVSVASNKFVDAVGNPNASSVSAVSQAIFVEQEAVVTSGSISVAIGSSSAKTFTVTDTTVISDGNGAVTKSLSVLNTSTGATILPTSGSTYTADWSSGYKVVLITTDASGGTTIFESTTFSPGGNFNQQTVVTSTATLNSTKIAPIALDLNNDGIHYISTDAGATYDYNHDGIAESTAWVAPEDGLLAIQKEDGTHNIVFSTEAGETDLQGLAKVYDSNKDGVLDAKDADFAKFGVWQDADSDGVVDSGEYLTLADRGITSLSLTSDGQVHFEANGDVIVYGQTTYTTADGELHIAEDVGFAVSDVYEPLDIAAIIANADAIESVTRIDQLAETDSSSSLMVELGGQTYEIATLLGQEVGTQDILSQFVGGDTSANLLTNKSWTDVIDIASDHGGPGAIIAAGGTLDEGAYANGEGDWTVVINSGDAKVDATNNQITFSSDSAENSVTITTADGSSHNIDNVDKIQWHG